MYKECFTLDNNDTVTLDFSFFKKDDNEGAKIIVEDDSVNIAKNKTKRQKRSKSDIVTVEDSSVANPIPGSNVAETNYAGSYRETNDLLKGAIYQADQLSAEIKSDIDAVRASKTIKNKYTYVTNLTASAGSLLSAKIAAIKELNASITQAHNLELNRFKALKPSEHEGNDDMRMMDIYSAFVNTPIGSYTPAAPSIQDITIGSNNPNSSISAITMVPASGEQQTNQLSPEQNRMRMESNPNIQTVVRYNQATGQRYFDVIDKSNGISVPNYPRPDAFLLEDSTIDIHSGIARNRNINAVWPLIIEGSDVIGEY